MVNEEGQEMPDNEESEVSDPIESERQRRIEETLRDEDSDDDSENNEEDSESDASDDEHDSSDHAPQRRKVSDKQRQKSRERYSDMYRERRIAEENLSAVQADLTRAKSDNARLNTELTKLMSTVEEYKGLYENLINSTFDPDNAERLIKTFKEGQATKSSSSEGTGAKVYTEAEIEALVEKKVDGKLSQTQSTAAEKEANLKSQERWKEQVNRVRKEYKDPTKFDEVIREFVEERNPERLKQNIGFLKDIDHYPYAMEALHAASKERGFWDLSSVKKAALVGEYHSDIKRSKTAVTKSETTSTPKGGRKPSGSAPLDPNKMSPREHFAWKHNIKIR